MIQLYLFLVGVIVSEFIQLLVDRDNNPSSLYGRSKCDHCHKPIVWYAMIPVFGYLLTLGKCSHCGKKISIKYFIFEVTFALSWAAILLLFTLSIPQAILLLALLLVTFYLAYSDWSTHMVSVIALAVWGILLVVYHFQVSSLLFSLFDAAAILFIILLSVGIVKIRNNDLPILDMFGPADWIVLTVSALLIGFQNTVIIIVAVAWLLMMQLFVQKFVYQQKIKAGIPLLFYFLPLFLFGILFCYYAHIPFVTLLKL